MAKGPAWIKYTPVLICVGLFAWFGPGDHVKGQDRAKFYDRTECTNPFAALTVYESKTQRTKRTNEFDNNKGTWHSGWNAMSLYSIASFKPNTWFILQMFQDPRAGKKIAA